MVMGLKRQVLKRGWLNETINGITVEVLNFLNSQWHSREVCYWASENVELLRGKRILDVGSGHGFVPLYLKQLGLEITASEHGPFPLLALDLAIQRAKLPIPVLRKWVTPIMTDPYDVVILARVFWEPDEVNNNLAIIERVKSRGGVVVLTSERVTRGTHTRIKREDWAGEVYMAPNDVEVFVIR